MINLKQNLFLADRQNIREDCNLLNSFEQRGRSTTTKYQDFISRVELSYDDFSSICEKVWAEPHNYIFIDKTRNRNIDGKLRIHWGWRILQFNYIYD